MPVIMRVMKYEGTIGQLKQQLDNSMIDGVHPFPAMLTLRTLDRVCVWAWESGTGLPEDEVRCDKLYCSERQAMDAADRYRYEEWKEMGEELPAPDPLMWKRSELGTMMAEEGDNSVWSVHPIEIEVD